MGRDWFVNVIGGSRDAKHKASCLLEFRFSLCVSTEFMAARSCRVSEKESAIHARPCPVNSFPSGKSSRDRRIVSRILFSYPARS